jgi:medium-chain acyl-[acyl-carrier-protein] hydrolase
MSSSRGARLRLCLFPCAGGSPSSYQGWSADLPLDVEPFAIQLPGRSERFREAPIETLPPVIKAICDGLKPLAGLPFAFFGHSLGALIAFEVCRELRRRNMPLPVHLFVAGRAAPQLPARKPLIHQLPDASFLDELNLLGGIPPEALADDELMELLIPTLRADIILHETYVFAAEPPLACPITAFGGMSDQDVTSDDLHAWRAQTAAEFTYGEFKGGHFFVQTARQNLIEIILKRLDVGCSAVK